MEFLVKNVTPIGTDESKTLYVDSAIIGSMISPLGPQETLSVPDSSKDMLLKLWPQYISVLGTSVDLCSPVAYTATLTTSWVLVDLGKYCTTFKFQTTDTIAKVSFSGWNTLIGETEPSLMYQVPIPANPTTPGNNLLEFDMVMNPSRYIYVKGTGAAILTIFGL